MIPLGEPEGPAREPRPLSLETLPEELLQLIVHCLPTAALKQAALASATLHRHATNVLWQHVCLVDQWTLHADAAPEPLIEHTRGFGRSDEHDDTPIIRKLFILAANPRIACKVHSITHRCHLPTPNIFDELPRIHCHSDTLSQDARLHVLARLAIANLVNVHTLRIVYGHMRLASALVAGFLDAKRPQRVPLRKLWLETSCLSAGAMQSLRNSTALESLRIRRLHVASLLSAPRNFDFLEFRPSRGGMYYQMHNGAGNWAPTTVQFSGEGMSDQFRRFTDAELMDQAKAFDNAVWKQHPEVEKFLTMNSRPDVHETAWLPTANFHPMRWLLEGSAATLTSLNLDWVLWRRNESANHDASRSTLTMLAALRLPHLRAFQLRNAVLEPTRLPTDVFLFEDTFLEFMEYHHKLQCLAWPLDKIFSHIKPSVDVRNRVGKLIAHLANVLTELRLDAQYAGHGEPISDFGLSTDDTYERARRRRFIAEFAPHMRRIEHIKLEGGLPRDEKREILRALHYCPLKKVVMIGVSYPVGNTWGEQGTYLRALDPSSSWDDVQNLKEEDAQGIFDAYRRGFHMPDSFEFEPEYGWPPQAPLLQTIALHHASTVEELKICGYNGCPILSQSTPITDPLLNGLRQFDNLKQLVMSFWLLTCYEGQYRDTEIIKYWMDSRSPASTALVVVTPPRSPDQDLPVGPGHFPVFQERMAPPQDFNRWAVVLKTSFSPSALAYRVARDIGPYLSPVAKSRPGGVRMRASFCLGVRDELRPASDIFDLDMRIGRENQVLEFTGPREESEKVRFWQKLESRRWF
ncbi:hypothetical protein BDU57DRAFT_502937 [Ampelomyces quisqualis]|uniref:F-box domain-containing protein n=1 Tax=Ampelomyces quisqualis TaxID=50730 RepID=A0A6A5QGI4_AMPQU|nr:hypothetical protein BDU57DRAFT_502937 [Ampelomyces quisqualis]